jgi:hypothetical protein
MNVLLIEDDKRIAGLVERGLLEDGHRVAVTHNGAEGALVQEKKTHLLGREARLIRLLKDNQLQHVTDSLDAQLQNYALVTHEGNLVQLRRLDGSIGFRFKSLRDRVRAPAHRQPVRGRHGSARP